MSSAPVTPEEAGRRAQAMALERAANISETRGLETVLAHAGVVPGENIPMSPPLEMATTYSRPADGPYSDGDSVYTRADNPTRILLEREVERLECYGRTRSPDAGTQNYSYAFASGMMAASSIILAHSAPLQVILPHDLYHGVPVSPA
jgi:cystathionine gamma-synthase